ncbi:hypothetical protein ACIQMO_07770 [Streptomyces sp. NPDC091406]|uniref:hypothetical protein n=1 Tax=unclassified Streptomyces TaxID=2593676 RepID=UPI0038119A12
MRRQTYGSTGRRGTAIAASAAALCLGAGLLSGCGSGPGDGYTAVGAAAGKSKNPSEGDRAPSGEVTLIPLDEGEDGGHGRGGGGGASPSGGGSSSPSSGANDSGAAGPGGSGGARTGTAGGQAGSASDGAGTRPSTPTTPSGPSTPGSGSGSGSGSSPGGGSGTPSQPDGPGPGPDAPGTSKPPAPPATPAALTLSAPQRAAGDKRWCEKVTVRFRNTGGTPARSGTVTFATHIIGALGVDWATITSQQPLPAPIGAGSSRSQTYTVCVESWRVPLGMRIETQDVSAVWE